MKRRKSPGQIFSIKWRWWKRLCWRLNLGECSRMCTDHLLLLCDNNVSLTSVSMYPTSQAGRSRNHSKKNLMLSFCTLEDLWISVSASVVCISVGLSFCLSDFLSECLWVCSTFCRSLRLHFCLSVFLSDCMSFFLSFSLSICLSVCMYAGMSAEANLVVHIKLTSFTFFC